MLVPNPRSAVPPTPVQLAKVLLVEGATPSHFFEALIKHLGLENAIEIRSYGGIQQLRTFLAALASTAQFRLNVRSLGIVRDAETDYQAALNSVTAAVNSAQLQSVSVSSYILPDNHAQGMIESLCVQAVENLPIFECVRKFIECARAKGAKLPDGIRISKHEVQAYLSVLEKVQMMPGLAAYHNSWDFDATVWDGLKEFLRKL